MCGFQARVIHLQIFTGSMTSDTWNLKEKEEHEQRYQGQWFNTYPNGTYMASQVYHHKTIKLPDVHYQKIVYSICQMSRALKKMCSWKINNNKQTKASEQTLEELLPNAKLAMNETLPSSLWYLCLYNRTFKNVMHFLNLSAPLLAIIVWRHNRFK